MSRSRLQTFLAGLVRPEAPSVGRTWFLLAIAVASLVTLTCLEFLSGSRGPLDFALVLFVGTLTGSAVLSARAAGVVSERQRYESESFTRILQALSRSVSPDAIVDAIVNELGAATSADHVAVVRLRPRSDVLEATLVSMRPGTPASNTLLPARLLDVSQTHADRHRPPPGPVAQRGPGRNVPVSRQMARPVHGPGSRPNARRQDAELEAKWESWRQGSGSEFLGDAAPKAAGRDPGWRPRGNGVPDERQLATEAAERIAYRLRLDYGLPNTLAAPLRADGHLIGAIVLSRRMPGKWPDGVARLLESASAETSAALARVYSYEAAEVRARTDELTQMPNRRYFDEYCSLVVERRRSTDHIAVLSIDVDHFKLLNDRFGHPVGDEVLRSIGGAIQDSVRDEDVPARYGGEEFVVLLRNPARGVPFEIGERIRRAVRSLDLGSYGIDQVTVSVGVASATGPDETIAEIVDRADRALYAAKRSGRDRVVEAPSERPRQEVGEPV